jgi:hypothetical protein
LNGTGTANSAFGYRALYSNTFASGNSAFGDAALFFNTASNNAAFGSGALFTNTSGNSNSAFGQATLFRNTTGGNNSGFGESALQKNTTGANNSAFGQGALYRNETGRANSAFGRSALRQNRSGYRNVAVGTYAGRNQTIGDDNIYIANEGLAGESGQIKIGNTTDHTQATIAGIHGNTSAIGNAVLVNSSGVLGTTTSSIRGKQDVRDIGDDSEVLSELRPVRFRYREELVGEADAQIPQYGLVAEEVAAVAPELVTYDDEGKPYSVRYHVLPSLLLNEMQKQQRVNEEQRQVIAALADRLGQVEEKLAAAPTETDR